jgi:RimJ/RimL family protein N-acetyltransferase
VVSKVQQLVGRAVCLRPVGPRDVDTLWHLRRDRDVSLLVGNLDVPSLEQWRRMYVRNAWHYTGDPNDLASFAIATVHDDQAIGMVGLRWSALPHRAAELSMWLGKPYWSRGYGTDALQVLLGYAFDELGLHKVFLRVLVQNPRAIRCYEKCGFTSEGVHRSELHMDGRWHDLLYMGLLAEDYRSTVLTARRADGMAEHG